MHPMAVVITTEDLVTVVLLLLAIWLVLAIARR